MSGPPFLCQARASLLVQPQTFVAALYGKHPVASESSPHMHSTWSFGTAGGENRDATAEYGVPLTQISEGVRRAPCEKLHKDGSGE